MLGTDIERHFRRISGRRSTPSGRKDPDARPTGPTGGEHEQNVLLGTMARALRPVPALGRRTGRRESVNNWRVRQSAMAERVFEWKCIAAPVSGLAAPRCVLDEGARSARFRSMKTIFRRSRNANGMVRPRMR
jgi:hypothetical protein